MIKHKLGVRIETDRNQLETMNTLNFVPIRNELTCVHFLSLETEGNKSNDNFTHRNRVKIKKQTKINNTHTHLAAISGAHRIKFT